MSADVRPKLPEPLALAQSSVVIAGGTSGVGLAAAMQFAAAGVPRMVLMGRNGERGRAAAASVVASYPAADVHFISCDATDLASAESGVLAARERLGRIDVLVNSTAVAYAPELFHRTAPSELLSLLTLLALAPIYLSRFVLPVMREQRTGVIINIASDAAKVPTPGETVLGAAMAAIVMFSRTLALEAKRDGIRVNVLTPSLIEGTPTAQRVQREGFSAKLFAKAASLADLGVAVPDDLAALIVFLSGPAARRITGQAISVNGGISVA
jgi:2-hydroxycyclohexanecarboxyl-CoA dehydrogenase